MHHRIHRQWSFHTLKKLPLPLLFILVFLTACIPTLSVAQAVDPLQTDQEYTAAIKKGDQYFSEEKYDRALYEFETARKLKSGEKYPQERIRVINDILDDQKTKNILFEVAVTSAEKWYKAADYRRAKAEFENALRIDPTAQYPKDRLAQINKIWSDPEVDAKYAAAILHADDLFAQKRYLDAKGEYIFASDLKPYEQYPLDRIIAINEILAKLLLQQGQYNGIIARADGQFDKKEYAPARSSYQDASNIKPDEAYPKNRIKEIDAILEKLQAERDAYDRIVALADEYYMNKDFEKAKVEYEKAMAMKPTETYARNMIARIDPQIAEMQRIQSEYDLAMTNANTLLQKNDYAGARTMFEKAARLKPIEAAPKDKIAEIDRILSDMASRSEKEQRYLASVAKADSLFAAGSLEVAKSIYQQALTFKPGEPYPLQKIEEIDRQFTDAKAKEDAYAQAILEGDGQLAVKAYENARNAYQKASGIKPAESYPTSKIAEIDKILADKARIQKEYDAIILAADQSYNAKDYTRALTEYQKAKVLKPDEAYPVAQIEKINQLLLQAKNLEASYASHISTGDDLLKKKDYQNALGEFQQALSLKPAETYPKSRISEIEGILAGIAATEQAYQKEVRTGDSLFSATRYSEAITAYQNALKSKPGEVYPQQKVEEIIRIQTDIKATEEAFQKAIVQGDRLFAQQNYPDARLAFVQAREIKPTEAYPQQKIGEIDLLLSDLKSKEDAYAQAIREGDSQFASKAYDDARSAYEKASGIMPSESYPKTKIAEIGKIMAEMARIQKEYETAIGLADEYFNAKDYTKALADYQKAHSLKPEETYPAEQTAKINQILEDIKNLEASYAFHISQGDGLLIKKDYNGAWSEYQAALTLKPNEAYPKNKISEVEGILADIAAAGKAYQQAVAAGDSLFALILYTPAITEYQKALKAKPDEVYPREKIDEINRTLAEMKANEEAYQLAITQGDKLFTQKYYEDARASYVQAQGLKPAESYPQQKISAIDLLLSDLKAKEDAYAQAIREGESQMASRAYDNALSAYQKASGIKPAESYPKTKIAEIEKIVAELARIQKEYETAIGMADQYFNAKDYTKALADYQKAQNLKPEEAYSAGQITKINQILEDMRNLEASYASHISHGDELLASKQYQEAFAEYRQALDLKPAELYPKNKISEIEAALAAIQARQQAYNEALSKADGLFNSKEYEKAKLAYQEAQNHDPGQSYPQDQIARINGILKDIELQKSYDGTVAKADQFFNAKDYDNARTAYQNAMNIKPDEGYPQSKIEEINTILAANEQARLESYNKAIEAGDSFFALQDYKSARVQYQNAISINPGQQYPKDKLKQVEQILLDKEMELKKAYQDAVARADNLYTQKILDEAIDAYMAAHEIKNDEVYPVNMINQIKKYIADHAIVDILNSSVIISNNTERKFDFTPVDIRQRKNNYIVMKARVLSETKPKVYLNYGKDSARSGGIVLKSIKDNEMNDYIIRVSAQDPWYRIDNSWLKLYSEGGDIEVTYIQISTAD